MVPNARGATDFMSEELPISPNIGILRHFMVLLLDYRNHLMEFGTDQGQFVSQLIMMISSTITRFYLNLCLLTSASFVTCSANASTGDEASFTNSVVLYGFESELHPSSLGKDLRNSPSEYDLKRHEATDAES